MFKESPTNLGAIIEKILEITVIIKPKISFDLYLRRYLFKDFNSFIIILSFQSYIN